MGTDDLGTAEHESGSAKHENGIGHPRYCRKLVRARKTRKWDPIPLILPKASPGVQNMKTGPDDPGTAENESGSAKHENGIGHPRYSLKRVQAHKTRKRDPTASVSPKTSMGEQDMKMGPDALGTAKNESGSAKLENGTPTPSLAPKMSPGAQNLKTGPDAFGTAENDFGSTKHENGKRCSRYRHPLSTRYMKLRLNALRTVENVPGRGVYP
jgi:hypothetical protein